MTFDDPLRLLWYNIVSIFAYDFFRVKSVEPNEAKSILSATCIATGVLAPGHSIVLCRLRAIIHTVAGKHPSGALNGMRSKKLCDFQHMRRRISQTV